MVANVDLLHWHYPFEGTPGIAGGGGSYTFLTNHLASHGYIVAGLNHSELVALELGRRDGETPEQRAARAETFRLSF